MNHFDFSNRTAVVTGGAAGIGYTVARRLKAGGATVAIWDRDSALLETIQASEVLPLVEN